GPKTDWQDLEWRKALEATWSDPHKQLLGVLIGKADAPPFLKEWKMLRLDPSSTWDSVIDQLATAVREGKGKSHDWRQWRAATRGDLNQLQTRGEALKPKP